jgi:5-oxopent-3-ene-1,2,5-tricarboxylate decarboxylase / 2-hydroxyhepta-2,4-diene-1,7-dioate isomerase
MSGTREFRRIVLDGGITLVEHLDGELVAPDGRRVAPDDAVHLPPCTPTKIICVHLNYRSRVEQLGTYMGGREPSYFHKPVSSLNSHRGSVVKPAGTSYLNYEGEVAVVIGRTARRITPEQAADHIAGYTIADDFGLHDFRDADANAMLRVKGADTLGAVGPGLVEGWRPQDQRLRTLVNGEVVQDDTMRGMIWTPEYLIADLARLITLEPGDLILTGTPANSLPVQVGDVVTVQVEGLGELTNVIVEGEPVPPGGAMPTDSDHVRGVALGRGLPPGS